MKKQKLLSIVLSFSMVLGLLHPIPAKAVTNDWNLALEQPVTASSIGNGAGPELAVDGNQSSQQWNSVDMKTSSTTGCWFGNQSD